MTAFAVLAVLASGLFQAGASGSGGSPYYTADSIANSAAGVAGLYAPRTFVTIYGQNLAYTTRALQASDISNGTLPTVLGGTGVRVLINNIPANIYYVSPGQVNLLVPTSLIAGPVTLQVVVLYASGAGPTDPAAIANQMPQQAASVTPLSSFTRLLTGSPVDPRQILYAGVTPAFAG